MTGANHCPQRGYDQLAFLRPQAILCSEKTIQRRDTNGTLSLLSLLLILCLISCRDDPAPPAFDCPDPEPISDDDDSGDDVSDDDDDSVDDDDTNADDDDATPPPQNSSPTAPTVELLPADAGEQDDLHCVISAEASDADGDSLTYQFSWLVDGVGISGQRSLIPAEETTYGTEWTCQVIASDGKATSPAGTASVIIGTVNSPPTAPGLIIEPAQGEAAAPLYCLIDQASEDADGDEVYYSYRWELNEVPTDYTTSVIDGTLVLDGDCWTCVVVPFDHTSVGPATADSVCIMAGPIIPPTAPTVEILMGADGSLECVITLASEVPGDPAAIITYLFAWEFDDGSGPTTTSIDISEVDSSLINSGETWTCSATPYDGVEFGDPGEDSFTVP